MHVSVTLMIEAGDKKLWGGQGMRGVQRGGRDVNTVHTNILVF